jgi:hypothetical protein
MNAIAKSLLIGLALGLTTYFIVSFTSKSKKERRYTLSYNLELEARDSSGIGKQSTLFVETEAILRRRMEGSGYTFSSTHTGNDSLLEIIVGNATDTAVVNKLLVTEGFLQILEVYHWQDLQDLIKAADSIATSIPDPEIRYHKETPAPRKDSMAPEVRALLDTLDTQPLPASGVSLFEFIDLSNGNFGAVVKTADTAKLGKILRADALQTFLPYGAQFCYGMHPSRYKKNHLDLFVINTSRAKTFAVQNKHVVSAWVEIPVYDERPAVYFNLSVNGARMWAALTEKNVGRPLAILVDDKVISAPTVNEKIAGGSAVINGDFTEEEAQTIANMIQLPELPARVAILKSRVTSQKGIWNPRHILLALLAFGVASVLTWFVFKALKST